MSKPMQLVGSKAAVFPQKLQLYVAQIDAHILDICASIRAP